MGFEGVSSHVDCGKNRVFGYKCDEKKVSPFELTFENPQAGSSLIGFLDLYLDVIV